MIFGDINNTRDMEKIYPDPIIKAINHLKSVDLNDIEAGKYEIQGQDIYYNVVDVETKDKKLGRPEIHKKFIDIHFLIKGEELIGFARDSSNNRVSEELFEKRDILFYENVENEMDLVMKPGNFVILFPNDVHRAACVLEKKSLIRKVIVKINTQLL